MSFPEILVGAISWVLFYKFAVFPLVQNKSVLNQEQERESRSCFLFNTDLSCTKGGEIPQSYKMEFKKIAIHPDL